MYCMYIRVKQTQDNNQNTSFIHPSIVHKQNTLTYYNTQYKFKGIEQ